MIFRTQPFSAFPPPYTPPQGRLFSWGYNRHGEMGIGVASGTPAGPYYNFSSPVQVGGLSTWTSISTGWNEVFGTRSDKATFAWGAANGIGLGLLGLGDSIDRSSPTQLGSPGQWTSISSGANWASAALKNGKAYLWGSIGGSVGNGPPLINGYPVQNASIPIQLGARADWQQLSTQARFAKGIIAGKLYVWGENDWANCGLGYHSAAGGGPSSPVLLGSRTDWHKIINGKNLTTGVLDNAGILWTWGQSNSGQLGNGTIGGGGGYIASPVQVIGGHTWSDQIAIGYDHVLAIDRSGYLWVWGGAARGALGLGGPLLNISSPVQLGSSRWIAVSAGQYWSLGITVDGKLWAWGKNVYGRLGLGDIIDRSSPVQVGSLTTWKFCCCGFYTGFGIAT